jgi:hypothetical protein
MTSITDALSAADPGTNTLLHPALAQGVDILGQHETATFYPYIRTVLPIDRFVFWLRADLLSPQQLAHHGLSSPAPVVAEGTLHYASQGAQVEDETIVVRSVDFTSLQPVAAFGAIAPDVMYVASWQTSLGSFQFTFSRRNAYFFQANIHHYIGDAIYPAFAAQLIDNLDQFDQNPIVSNSLPLWLAAISGVPYGVQLSPPAIQLYPAFLVPDNLSPPYGVISIAPEGTRPIASMPFWNAQLGSTQLVSDRVRMILYGLRADQALDFRDYILQYSLVTNNFGIMNMPMPVDDRRTQVELTALAQKKWIDFEISYLQKRARDVAQQVIASALVGFQMASFAVIPEEPIIPGSF